MVQAGAPRRPTDGLSWLWAVPLHGFDLVSLPILLEPHHTFFRRQVLALRSTVCLPERQFLVACSPMPILY